MSKYRNHPTVVDNTTFASRAEATRYMELKLLERAGHITDLELQPKFPFDVKGHRVGKYIADFLYRDADGRLIVEDVKSPITAKNPLFRLKAKLFKAIYGFDVTLVGKGVHS